MYESAAFSPLWQASRFRPIWGTEARVDLVNGTAECSWSPGKVKRMHPTQTTTAPLIHLILACCLDKWDLVRTVLQRHHSPSLVLPTVGALRVRSCFGRRIATRKRHCSGWSGGPESMRPDSIQEADSSKRISAVLQNPDPATRLPGHRLELVSWLEWLLRLGRVGIGKGVM